MPLISSEKILIIQIRRIGDVLLTTPVIRALRRAYPKAHIDFLTNDLSSDVIFGNPYLNDVVVMPEKATQDFFDQLKFIFYIRSRGYDMILDFLGTPRSAYITAFSGAEHRIGFKFRGRQWAYNYKIAPDTIDKYMVKYKFDLLNAIDIVADDVSLEEIQIPQRSKKIVNEFLAAQKINNDKLIIAISPTSRRKARMWTTANYARLIDMLATKYNAYIILLYGPGEKEVIDEIMNLVKEKITCFPPVSLKELAYLIKKCDILIGNDNGIMHLAVAMKTPTLTIYGPSGEGWKCLPSDNFIHKGIIKDVPCKWCGKHECDDHICMKNLTCEEVENKFQEMVSILISRKNVEQYRR